MLRPAVVMLSAVMVLLALTGSLSHAMQAVPAQSSSQVQSGREAQAKALSSQLAASTWPTDSKTLSSPAPDVPSQTVSGTLTNTFLPLVGQNWCSAPGTDPVPFGIEIAALHQVVTSTTAGEQSGQLNDAQWRDYLDSAFPTLVAALQDSGAGWTRVNIAWRDIEPNAPVSGQPPQYTWDWYDSKLKALAGTGVQIIATINSAPTWAADPPCGPLKAGRLADYGQYVTDLVKHYMQPPYNVTHWEIVNEPDYVYAVDAWARGYGCWGNQGAAYAQTLAVAYRAVKSADPRATVIMGGLAYDFFTEYAYNNPRGFNRYFIDDVMAAGGGTYADAFAIHYFTDFRAEWERWVAGSQDRQVGWLYAPACGNPVDNKNTDPPPLGPQRYEPWGFDLTAKTSHFISRLRTCYGMTKPLWVTELAQHGYPHGSPTVVEQARYVIQGITRGLAGGATNVMWYALATPNDTTEQQLLYNDLTPKPAFYAFKTLATELKGYQYARSVNTTGIEGYVFAAPCAADVTVAWGTGALSFGAKHVRVVSYLGNVSNIDDGGPGDRDRIINGRVMLQLTDDPVFLQVTG